MNEIEMYKTEQRASDSLRIETCKVRMRPRRKYMAAFAEATRMARSDMKDPMKSDYWKSQVGEKYKTPMEAACAFYYSSLKQKEEIRLKKVVQKA